MNANSFTYGCEVEGVFSQDILEVLPHACQHFNTKRDGSVHTDDIFRREIASHERELYSNHTQEITMGIFLKQETLLKTLLLLDKKSHKWDISCGLHLHIKPRRNIASTQAKVIDYAFLKKIETFAYTHLCSHVKDRQRNHFCQPYKDVRRTVFDFNDEEKYRFVRLHPNYGTFEFRFFAPCEHKVSNIKTFLDYFVKHLNKVQPKKQATIIIKNTPTKKRMRLARLIKPRYDNTLEFSYIINKREVREVVKKMNWRVNPYHPGSSEYRIWQKLIN